MKADRDEASPYSAMLAAQVLCSLENYDSVKFCLIQFDKNHVQEEQEPKEEHQEVALP